MRQKFHLIQPARRERLYLTRDLLLCGSIVAVCILGLALGFLL